MAVLGEKSPPLHGQEKSTPEWRREKSIYFNVVYRNTKFRGEIVAGGDAKKKWASGWTRKKIHSRTQLPCSHLSRVTNGASLSGWSGCCSFGRNPKTSSVKLSVSYEKNVTIDFGSKHWMGSLQDQMEPDRNSFNQEETILIWNWLILTSTFWYRVTSFNLSLFFFFPVVHVGLFERSFKMMKKFGTFTPCSIFHVEVHWALYQTWIICSIMLQNHGSHIHSDCNRNAERPKCN